MNIIPPKLNRWIDNYRNKAYNSQLAGDRLCIEFESILNRDDVENMFVVIQGHGHPNQIDIALSIKEKYISGNKELTADDIVTLTDLAQANSVYFVKGSTENDK